MKNLDGENFFRAMTGSKRLAILCLGICGVFMTGLLWQHSRRPESPASLAKVTTVLRLKIGTAPGTIATTLPLDHQSHNFTMESLAPIAMDESGIFYLVDGNGLMTVVDQKGSIIAQKPLAGTAYVCKIARGTGSTLWLSDVADKIGCWARLVCANTHGKLLWEIGSPGLPNAERVVPALPRAPGQDKVVNFENCYGLACDNSGDVFLNENCTTMRRFNKFGRETGKYDLFPPEPPSVARVYQDETGSAVVSRRGWVYAVHSTTFDHHCAKSILLDFWPSPEQHEFRILDFSRLNPNGAENTLLMGTDAADNLYFEYRYPLSDPNDDLTWAGPMAIARVGPDGVAHLFFDIYQYYHADAAEHGIAAPDAGCGDLIHVGPTGDLYLERGTPTEYWVDKIVVGPG